MIAIFPNFKLLGFSIFIGFLISVYIAEAANYYFSSSTGNDSRTAQEAQHAGTPWKSLNKLNAYFPFIQPGDSIFFKRGDIFEGFISISKSGLLGHPIVFTSYDLGNKPIISGFTTFTNWTPVGNGIWETDYKGSLKVSNLITINQFIQPVGRFPNKGYLFFQSHEGLNKIFSNEFPNSIDWKGAEAVIRKNRWTIDRNLIISQTENSISYVSGSGYEPTNNFGYFLQRHPLTLDQFGEWFHDTRTKKCLVYFGNYHPSQFTIQGSVVDNLISIFNKANIVFTNLSFTGSNENAFWLESSNNIRITHCDFFNSGGNVINAIKGNGITIEACNIHETNNDALRINASNSRIRRNKIRNTALNEGICSKNGPYAAISINGNNNIIEYNEIDSTGYIGIGFTGDFITIRQNYINHFAIIKDDGGGIYTYQGSNNKTIYRERKIANNIILNGKGAGDGTDNPSYLPANGIYIDDNSNNVDVLKNTVAYIPNYGIFCHNCNQSKFIGNTVYSNKMQLCVSEDKADSSSLIRNNIIKHNILFSGSYTQSLANFKTLKNDLTAFGEIDSNFYCSPFNEPRILSATYFLNADIDNFYSSLDKWKSLYHFDRHSKPIELYIPPFTVDRISGTNKVTNGAFDKNINNVAISTAAKISWTNDAEMDEGCLNISLSEVVDHSTSFVLIPVGTLKKGSDYVLSFSSKALVSDKPIGIYIKTNQPQKIKVPIQYCASTTERNENLFAFTNAEDASNASIAILFENRTRSVWIDNLSFTEASINVTNPADFIKFIINPGDKFKLKPLQGIYVDAKRRLYRDYVLIPPYQSKVLVRYDATFVQGGLITLKAAKL